MKRLIKLIRNTLVSIIVLYLALFATTKVIRYPEPIAAIKLGLAPASKTPELMPSHLIQPAKVSIEIPRGTEAMPKEVKYKSNNKHTKYNKPKYFTCP